MNDLSVQSGLSLLPVTKPRVAVLVDGDNIPHSDLAEIEGKAKALGDTVIRRVYADIGLRKDWAMESAYFTIHCTTSAGKNRADMHLVIGALDIAHRALATHFLIMSDDRDFGPLVDHLREIGMTVEWAGKPKPTLRRVPPISVALKVEVLTPLDKKLRTLLATSKTGCTLVRIGNELKGETVQKQTGKASWRAYFQSKPEVYSLSGGGDATIISLKNP